MNTVTSYEYEELKKKFFHKHNNEFQCDTQGNSAEYYHKTYVFEDGATWYEVMMKIYESVEAEAHGIKIPVEVELMQVEFWSSDDAESKYYFEPWDVGLMTGH